MADLSRPIFFAADFEEDELNKQFCDKRDTKPDDGQLLSKGLRFKGSKDLRVKGSNEVPREQSDNGELDLVSAAIANTAPSGAGQRHRAIFTFARHLKAISVLREKGADDLAGIFDRWLAHASEHIQTTDYEANWSDFADAWHSVKYAAGTSPVDDIFASISALPVPQFAQHERYDRRPVERKLISICSALHTRLEGKPFYLGSHHLSPLVGTTQQNVSRILRNLVRTGTLELVTRGTGRQAHYYRYHGEQEKSK